MDDIVVIVGTVLWWDDDRPEMVPVCPIGSPLPKIGTARKIGLAKSKRIFEGAEFYEIEAVAEITILAKYAKVKIFKYDLHSNSVYPDDYS